MGDETSSNRKGTTSPSTSDAAEVDDSSSPPFMSASHLLLGRFALQLAQPLPAQNTNKISEWDSRNLETNMWQKKLEVG